MDAGYFAVISGSIALYGQHPRWIPEKIKAHIDHLLRRSESPLPSDFMDVSQKNEEVIEQLDPCISRKPLAPLQGKTWPGPQLEKDAARSQTETVIHKAA